MLAPSLRQTGELYMSSVPFGKVFLAVMNALIVAPGNW